MRRTLFIALCAVFLSSPVYAQQACTEIGCTNGLVISTQGMSWPHGHYEIQFLLNDKTLVDCDGILPLKPCDKGPSFSCNSEGITIGESGCALPEDAHALSDIHINALPEKVMIKISYNGTVTHQKTFRPDYLSSRPNGPACEPVCNSATVFLNKAVKTP